MPRTFNFRVSRFLAWQGTCVLVVGLTLGGCADENSQVAAPAKKATTAQPGADTATSQDASTALLSTPELDQMNATMTQLEAQKTALTQKLSQVAIAASQLSSSTVSSDATNAKHSTVGDGIGVAAGAAGVALSVMTGGIGGIIMGGIGLISSGSTLVKDSQADAAHTDTVNANTATLAQVQAAGKAYQTQLDQVNTAITQLQAKIDAATASLAGTNGTGGASGTSGSSSASPNSTSQTTTASAQ